MAVPRPSSIRNPTLAALDPIWAHVRQEAEDIVRREPELATFIYSTVLHHERLEDRSCIASPSGWIIRSCRAT